MSECTCIHAPHKGLCGVEVEIQHVLIDCPCFVGVPLDVKELRLRNADQEKRLKELQQKDRGPRRHSVKYTRM